MKINICGDFTTEGSGAESVNEHMAFSANVRQLFAKSDFNVVNLEAPVINKKSNGKISKVGPNLCMSPNAINYLIQCNVGLVTLANNHFNDYGCCGIDNTLRELDEKGVRYVGGGRNANEKRKVYYYTDNGIKLSFLNFCENEFSTIEEYGSNPLDIVSVYHSIMEASNNSDYVIVITHGGHEGYNLPSPRMKELYRFFIEIGASVVINHHQHCYSGWEEYNGGKIFYGLGNFFFDDHRPARRRNMIWNYGYIVSLDIDGNGISSELIPYTQCLKDKTTILIEDEEGKREFGENVQRLNAIIQDDKELKRNFDLFCKTQYKNVITLFSPYNCRLLQALCRHGLLPAFLGKRRRLDIMNKMRCEAHRDVVINVLNQG